MRDINHLPRATRYYISNFNGLLSDTFCTAVTRTPFSFDAEPQMHFRRSSSLEESSVKLGSMASVFGIVALTAFVPSVASAQSGFGYGNYSQHDARHDQLEDRHDGNHEQLDEIHAEAHDEGLSRREHRQLHGELQYEHAEADYRLAREHQRRDRRAWQRRYSGRSYRPYYGY